MAPTSKPKTTDQYLATVNEAQRAALEKLRKAIKAAAPKAEECLSYGLPAFRLDGRPLVAYCAASNHCSFFPMSGATVKAHQAALRGYETSKGTIRFQPDNPLPAALVRKVVKSRIAENAARSGAKNPAARATPSASRSRKTARTRSSP